MMTSTTGVAAVIWISTQAAIAATPTYIYWDTNGAVANSSTSGTSGSTWDTGNTNGWNTSEDGLNHSNSYGKYPSVSTGASTVAVFAAGTDTTADYSQAKSVITLKGTVVAQGIVIKSGSIEMTGLKNAPVNTPSLLKIGDEGISLGPKAGTTFKDQTGGASSFGNYMSLVLTADQTWQNTSKNDLTIISVISSSVATKQTLTLNAASTGNITIKSGINDVLNGPVFAVVVNSTSDGVVTFDNNNSFTGGTNLMAGNVKANYSDAFGDSHKTLTVGFASVDLAIDSSISAYSTVVNGKATFMPDRATPGAGAAHTLGALQMSATTLTVNSGSQVSSGLASLAFGKVTLTGDAKFAVNNSTTSPSVSTKLSLDSVAGNYGVTKTGTGTLELRGQNTFSGPLVVNAGTVTLASGATLASRLSLTSTAVFDASAIGDDVTVAGLSGSGTAKVQSSKQLKVTGTLGSAGTADALNVTGGLTLGSNTLFDINLTQPSPYKDSVTVSQLLDYNNTALALQFAGVTSTTKFTLFQAGSYFGTPAKLTWTGLPANATVKLTSGDGIVTVTIPVPEPASLATIAVGGVTLVRRKRRLIDCSIVGKNKTLEDSRV